MYLAVEHHRLTDSRGQLLESIEMQVAPVLLPGRARMDGHMLQRHLPQHRHDITPLPGVIHPEPHLQRVTHRTVFGYIGRHLLHLLPSEQEPGTTAFGDLRREGASHIEVDTVNPLGFQRPGEPAHLLRVTEDYLGHKTGGLSIERGKDVAHRAPGRLPLLPSQERGETAVGPAEDLGVEKAVWRIGVALQGGHEQFHLRPPFTIMETITATASAHG